MKRLIVSLFLCTLALPAFSKTHKDTYTIPCSELWPAIKDTLRNSGKYGIISITNDEMTASYNIGGFLTGRRINTVLLNPAGSGCEMQVQTVYSGLENNDAGDFKKRVDESLAKLSKKDPAPPAPAPTK
ncbi:MAG TPA: hypothetical protein VL346_11750 [Acidobacteriaceae bacterium]|nr:hypothetical protein [Acidobacteriaceae bacterium]